MTTHYCLAIPVPGSTTPAYAYYDEKNEALKAGKSLDRYTLFECENGKPWRRIVLVTPTLEMWK